MMPHNLISLLFTMLLYVTCVPAVSGSDLDKQIAESEAQLDRLRRSIDESCNKFLPTTNDIEATISIGPLVKWLRHLTQPDFQISAYGTQRHGDLIYQPNVGKAWLEPERNTTASLRLMDFRLTGQQGVGLFASGWVRADATASIRTEIFHVGGNINCTGSLPRTEAKVKIELSSVSHLKLPYTVSLVRPDNVNVGSECDLGQLGKLKMTFPMNGLAKTISTGLIDLGFENTGSFTLPNQSGSHIVRYSITPSNTTAWVGQFTLNYRSDVNVQISR